MISLDRNNGAAFCARYGEYLAGVAPQYRAVLHNRPGKIQNAKNYTYVNTEVENSQSTCNPAPDKTRKLTIISVF